MAKSVLIQQSDALISLDLAQAVREAWPDATLVLCHTPEEAAAKLANAIPDVLLLESDCTLAQTVALDARSKGAQIVWTDVEPDHHMPALASGFMALTAPFTRDDILNALIGGTGMVPRFQVAS